MFRCEIAKGVGIQLGVVDGFDTKVLTRFEIFIPLGGYKKF